MNNNDSRLTRIRESLEIEIINPQIKIDSVGLLHFSFFLTYSRDLL